MKPLSLSPRSQPEVWTHSQDQPISQDHSLKPTSHHLLSLLSKKEHQLKQVNKLHVQTLQQIHKQKWKSHRSPQSQDSSLKQQLVQIQQDHWLESDSLKRQIQCLNKQVAELLQKNQQLVKSQDKAVWDEQQNYQGIKAEMEYQQMQVQAEMQHEIGLLEGQVEEMQGLLQDKEQTNQQLQEELEQERENHLTLARQLDQQLDDKNSMIDGYHQELALIREQFVQYRQQKKDQTLQQGIEWQQVRDKWDRQCLQKDREYEVAKQMLNKEVLGFKRDSELKEQEWRRKEKQMEQQVKVLESRMSEQQEVFQKQIEDKDKQIEQIVEQLQITATDKQSKQSLMKENEALYQKCLVLEHQVQQLITQEPLYKLQSQDSLKDELVQLRVELFALKQSHQSPDQHKQQEAIIKQMKEQIEMYKQKEVAYQHQIVVLNKDLLYLQSQLERVPEMMQLQEAKLRGLQEQRQGLFEQKQARSEYKDEPQMQSVQFRNESSLSVQSEKKPKKLTIAETVNQVLCPVHGSSKPDFKSRLQSFNQLII